MILVSEVSGRSKFGVVGADVGRIVWRIADNLYSVSFILWTKKLKLDTYICRFSCEKYNIEP